MSTSLCDGGRLLRAPVCPPRLLRFACTIAQQCKRKRSRCTATEALAALHHTMAMHSVSGVLLRQFLLGFGAYLYPTIAKHHREALGPLHTYLGKAVFIAGLANMAVR